MKKSIIIALAFSAPLGAQEVKWNYSEAGYVRTGLDVSSANGYFLSGSFLVGENVFVKGDYFSSSDSIKSGEVTLNFDVSGFKAGIGYRHQLKDTTDAYALLSYENYTVDMELYAPGFPYKDSLDGNAYAVEAGVRHMMGSNTEVGASVGFANYTGGTDFRFSAHARYYFTDNLYGQISAQDIGDIDDVRLGIGYAF